MYVSEHLNLRSFGKGRRDKSCSPTGPWEIRPTGMTTEACGTVCATGAGLRPAGKPGEMPPDPTVSCAPHSIQTAISSRSCAPVPRSRSGTWSVGQEGRAYRSEYALIEVSRPRGQPEGAVTGNPAVLRTRSTCEGGEPQGSRKGRPGYPLEGRGEQMDGVTR